MSSNNTNPRRRSQITPAQETTPTPRTFSLVISAPFRKGATFHAPSTPPSELNSPIISLPALLQRSATCPKSTQDALAASERRMAAILGSVDRSLATGSTLQPAESMALDDLPLPKLILEHSLSDMTDSHAPQSPQAPGEYFRAGDAKRQSGQRRHHSSDSGIGSTLSGSIQSPSECNEKPGSSFTPINRPQGSIVGVAGLGSFPPSKGQNMWGSRIEASNIGRSISIGLSQSAIQHIGKFILRPLSSLPMLKDFHSLVRDVPKGIQRKEILCLRDLEKTLIYMAPTRAKSADLYLEFCETSIRCIQATVDHISDREQRLPTDRPYTNGYFLDLVEQIREYAAQMAASREKQANGEELNEMDVSTNETIKLHGGLAQNGCPAQLVRVKNGKTIPIGYSEMPSPSADDSPTNMKRSLSEHSSDVDSVRRSMARRAKRTLTSQAAKEMALQKCGECDKEFKRPCDLTKHEKTHSRPWKCPETVCKYHIHGWPTEKERDRHVNDKHSAAPPMYECQFTPCTYRSKRESNCKQHMEKAHGWTYVRSKTNGKPQPAIATPSTPNIPTPTSTIADSFTPLTNQLEVGTEDGHSIHGSNSPQMPAFMGQPLDDPLGNPNSIFNFNEYPNSARYFKSSPAESASNQASLTCPWGISLDDIISANNADGTFLDPYAQETNIQSWNAQLITPDNSAHQPIHHRFPNNVVNLLYDDISNLSPEECEGLTFVNPLSPSHDLSFDEGFDEFTNCKPLNDFALFGPEASHQRTNSNEMFPQLASSGPLYAEGNPETFEEFSASSDFSIPWDLEEE